MGKTCFTAMVPLLTKYLPMTLTSVYARGVLLNTITICLKCQQNGMVSGQLTNDDDSHFGIELIYFCYFAAGVVHYSVPGQPTASPTNQPTSRVPTGIPTSIPTATPTSTSSVAHSVAPTVPLVPPRHGFFNITTGFDATTIGEQTIVGVSYLHVLQ